MAPGRPGNRPERPVAPKGGSGRIPRPADDVPPTPGGTLARVIRQAAPFLGAAWTLTAALLLGVMGGRWLDGRWNTEPWLTATGALVGLAVGLYEVARVALRLGQKRGR